MFHHEVLAAEGHVVDFDRASVLMDRDLLSKSLRAMIRERNATSSWTRVWRAVDLGRLLRSPF